MTLRVVIQIQTKTAIASYLMGSQVKHLPQRFEHQFEIGPHESGGSESN